MELMHKEGDWMMLGYEPVQIKQARDSGGYVVSTGTIETSGMLGDKLYPMTLKNKACADSVAYHRKEMGNMCRSVNWPKIANWIEYELARVSGDDEEQKEFLDKLSTIHRELRDLQDKYFEALPDIPIFRR